MHTAHNHTTIAPPLLRHNILLFLTTASIVFTFLSTCSKPIDAYTADQCDLHRDITENDLSITDVVLESAKGDTTCLKAKFRLRIKVEGQQRMQINQTASDVEFLGYIPLDSVVDVENTCPDDIATVANKPRQPDNVTNALEELTMAVQFHCGNLTFTFRKKASNVTLLTLEGSVNLDDKSITKSPFASEKPVVFLWDPSKHFKLNDPLEIKSNRDQSNDIFLTANFFNLEVEFRNTKNRDFIKPPDEKSKAASYEEFQGGNQ